MRTPLPGGVLCLDLAGVVGWAYGDPACAAPEFGTWALPRFGGEGARYAAFENELAATLEACAPRALILEAPLPLPAQTNMGSCRQQLTLRGLAYAEAYRASVAISEIDALTVRAEVLGKAGFRKNEVKQVVVGYCRRRGWMVPDHNAADACMLWEWNRRRVRHIAPCAGPLWREVAD